MPDATTIAEKIEHALGNCPWPDSVWPMSLRDVARVIPDEHARTAVAGTLARFGWERAQEQVRAVIAAHEDDKDVQD